MRTWMSLMRLIASWLESTSQRPSDARIMISSCVVSISSRTSGVATCTPHPFLQSPSIHFTHILVGFYLVISKHFLSSLSIVSIPIHVFAPNQVVQHPNNEFKGGTIGSDFQESSAKTIGNDQKEGHSQPPEVGTRSVSCEGRSIATSGYVGTIQHLQQVSDADARK